MRNFVLRSRDLEWLGLWMLPPGVDNNNLLGLRAAAIELQHIGLVEALELTLPILARSQRVPRRRTPLARRYLRHDKATVEEATAVLGAAGHAGRAAG